MPLTEDNEVLILRELGKLNGKVDLLQTTATTLLTETLRGGERLNRHGRRIKRLEVAADDSPAVKYQADRAEITGTHEFAEIQRIIQEKRDSGIWWKRQRWTWAMAATGAVLLATLSGCITYAVSHLH